MDYALQIPSWFPDEENPYSGNFIEKHISSIARYFPVITLKVVGVVERKEERKIEKRGNEIIITYYYNHKKGSIYKRIRAGIHRSYLYRKAMRELEKEFGTPNLIHLHVAYPMGRVAVKWSREWGVPLLLSEHWSIYHPQNRHKMSFLLRKNLNCVYKQVKYFTAVSENLRQTISSLFPGKKSRVIPNVVNVNIFSPVDKAESAMKTILHISTLDDAAKNFSGILNAIRALSHQRSDFVLQVIHENRNEEAELFVKKYNLSDRVHFLGRKDEEEVATYLQRSDFLLLFSNYENLPCVILESFACGKPVLATPVGGIPEIMDSSRGVFVKVKDEKELVLRLNEMLDKADQYDAKELRHYAINQFSYEVVGRQFYELYQEILRHSEK